ncbi:MAG: type II secretion system F family protein [Bacilli bacterium]|nr:type II secretion system F family protein [Bacilli bacterium]
MLLYNCKVLDELGQNKIIVKEANDEVSLRALLKRDNYILLSATVIKEKKPNTFLAVRSKVPFNEVVSFLREFSIMVKASISIADSLNVLRKQKFSKIFQKVLSEIYNDVMSGVILSEAFRKHPKVFPNFFINMVAIGEESGSLDTVLSSMADYYENDRRIKRKVKGAMVYPIIVSVLIIVVILFMTLFVLPQFESTINELGGDIPTLTRVIMNISEFFVNNIFIIIPAILAVVLIIILYFKTESGKYSKDYLKLHLPILGTVQKNLITSRFTKAFIILLESGMNITDAMENVSKMLDNKLFEEKFRYSIEEVKRGKRIAKSIENTKIFPLMLTEMINVGEKSGDLEGVLKSTSRYFEDMVESSITKATAALEPLMIITLGVIVGVVILAIFLPIISLMQNIG